MKARDIRYCRCIFINPEGRKLNVDFGYFGWDQRLATISDLRKLYSDFRLLKQFSIDSPEWNVLFSV